jgi:hypothetical protein
MRIPGILIEMTSRQPIKHLVFLSNSATQQPTQTRGTVCSMLLEASARGDILVR